MKPRCSHQSNLAMTLVEVLVVIVVLAFLAVILMPAPIRGKKKATTITCVNNLKQIGLAYRIWAGDNGDQTPMGIPVKNGGSLEMVATGNVVQTFLLMSNALSAPKILLCPSDNNRVWVANFSELSNSNISYFVGVDVTNHANPQAFLSGDSNFEIADVPVKPGLAQFTTRAY